MSDIETTTPVSPVASKTNVANVLLGWRKVIVFTHVRAIQILIMLQKRQEYTQAAGKIGYFPMTKK